MKKYILLLIVSSYITTVSSQNTLEGSIFASNNQNPLEATVYIPLLEKGTVANFDGNFKINNIPNGNYIIAYTMVGYATITENIAFNEGAVILRNIELDQAAIEMEEVIISTPFHKLQRDNVMKVERLSASDISNSGALTLAGGITEIPGVSTISTGVGIGKPVIRGLSSNRVLTYTQGVRLENQQFGGEHGLGINAEGVASIEVIKGPASLLYGSDALGGVLYINPERFAPEHQTKASIKSVYNTNTLGSSTTLGLKSSQSKFKFLFRGTHATHSDYKTGNNERVTHSRFNENDIKAAFGYQNKTIKSSLRYNYNQSKIGIPEEIGEQTTSKEMELPYQKIDNHILSLDNKVFLNNASLNIVLSYLFNDRNEFEDDFKIPELHLRLNTYGYNIRFNVPDIKNFETVVAVQGMYQTNKNFSEEILIPDAITNDFGIMGTTHYHLDKISFQGGIRYDTRSLKTEEFGIYGAQDYIASIDKNFNSFNAALGLKIDLLESFYARINLASGFRAPNLAELASNGVHEGTNRYEIGNASLNNEQNFQIDTALEFKNEHFEVFANVFYNHINQYIYIEPTDRIMEDYSVYIYTQEDAQLYGGEFGLHFHPHPLDWLHLSSSFETVTGKQLNGDFLPLQPANSLSNTLKIEFEKLGVFKKIFFLTRFKNTFKQNNVSAFETPTGAYNLLNMAIGAQVKILKLDTKLGIRAANITDQAYISHLSRLKADGIENIGRSINFSLQLQL